MAETEQAQQQEQVDTGTEQGTQEATSAEPEWLGRLEGSLKSLDERFDGFQSQFAQEPDAAQEPDEPSYDDLGWLNGDQELDAAGVQREFDQAITSRAEGTAQQAINTALAPILERFRQDDAKALETKYPELATDDGAKATMQAAEQFVAQAGMDPAKAYDPKILEVVFLAEKARQRAAEETPAGAQPGVPIEQGGMAGGQSQHESAADIAQRIVNAGPKRGGFSWM